MNTPTPPNAPQRILTRLNPCHCGCKGADSWHKPYIKRSIRDFQVVTPERMGRLFIKVAVGRAKMPWGMEDVTGEVICYGNGDLGRSIQWSLTELR